MLIGVFVIVRVVQVNVWKNLRLLDSRSSVNVGGLEPRGPGNTLFFEMLQRNPWSPTSHPSKMAFPLVIALARCPSHVLRHRSHKPFRELNTIHVTPLDWQTSEVLVVQSTWHCLRSCVAGKLAVISPFFSILRISFSHKLDYLKLVDYMIILLSELLSFIQDLSIMLSDGGERAVWTWLLHIL